MLQFLKRHDWPLNLAVLFLAAASLIIIYSISPQLFRQQLLWFAIAGFFAVAFSLVNWRSLSNYRWFVWGIYIFAILLLATTLIFGSTIRGSQSWLVIGPFQFQTSELAKLALIIVFASFFTKRHIAIAHFSTLLKTFVYFLIPAALVLLQPDLGTVLVLFCLWIGFLLVSGLPWRYIFVGLAIFSLVAVAGWSSIKYCSKENHQSSEICSKFLKEYQRKRILALFNSAYEPLGANYSVIQSKIAIGSAGFFGKGFQQGTQVQLGFLPEAATDFTLAAFIEEWGLVGGLAVIGAFIFLIWRIVRIGLLSRDNFSSFVCLGTALMFLAQFALNAGSEVGLLPVIGVTFPFLSYGGSSLLINSMLVGIIQGIAARSKF